MRHSGKAMDVQQPNTANGARVGQYTYGGNAWQQWQFQDAGSGYWRLVSRHSGKCLDVVGASTADGAELIQYTCGSGANQQFQMVANGGYFQLRARHSGKCVDVPVRIDRGRRDPQAVPVQHRHQPAVVPHGRLTEALESRFWTKLRRSRG